ncbi:hypothetical protein Lalb_Chr11g0072241 [Lupinus albus]|uniref:Uncharacterized protein n=1 Tax=Lupinus albus TaxID=3870 RepID=A0A6A4PSI8_LUPAL|nr:hypothetical protein Lalb_Chr11g0072241 [Lupinus albus]
MMHTGRHFFAEKGNGVTSLGYHSTNGGCVCFHIKDQSEIRQAQHKSYSHSVFEICKCCFGSAGPCKTLLFE